MIPTKYLIWYTLVLLCVSGGWLGWWYASRTFYQHNIGPDVLREASRKPKVFMWRKLRRIIWTAGGSAAGMFTALIALQGLTRIQN